MAKDDCGGYGCFGVFVNEEAMNHAMFWFIEGQKALGISITIEKSILMFMKKNGISVDQLDVDPAKMKYNRFQKDLIERMKNG